MKFSDAPSGHFGEFLKQLFPFGLGQMHSLGIDNNPHHDRDWLVASAIFIAIAKFHALSARQTF